MNIVKTLLISFLIFSLGNVSARSTDPCREIIVETNIKHTSNGLADGELTLLFSNKEQYTIFLFGQDGNRLDLKDYVLKNLKKGDYNVVIRNKMGCTKRLLIKIN